MDTCVRDTTGMESLSLSEGPSISLHLPQTNAVYLGGYPEAQTERNSLHKEHCFEINLRQVLLLSNSTMWGSVSQAISLTPFRMYKKKEHGVKGN